MRLRQILRSKPYLPRRQLAMASPRRIHQEPMVWYPQLPSNQTCSHWGIQKATPSILIRRALTVILERIVSQGARARDAKSQSRALLKENLGLTDAVFNFLFAARTDEERHQQRQVISSCNCPRSGDEKFEYDQLHPASAPRSHASIITDFDSPTPFERLYAFMFYFAMCAIPTLPWRSAVRSEKADQKSYFRGHSDLDKTAHRLLDDAEGVVKACHQWLRLERGFAPLRFLTTCLKYIPDRFYPAVLAHPSILTTALDEMEVVFEAVARGASYAAAVHHQTIALFTFIELTLGSPAAAAHMDRDQIGEEFLRSEARRIYEFDVFVITRYNTPEFLATLPPDLLSPKTLRTCFCTQARTM